MADKVICFIPSGDHAAFIEREDGASLSGNFVDEEGRIISEHKGIAHYTVGQRRGLGISAASRLFVKSIDAKTGDITVTPIDPTATRVKLSGVVYSGMPEAPTPVKLRLSAKLRYAASPVPATVTFNMEEASVELDAPHRAVTPGQSCVLYDGDILVAGGFIDCAE